MANRRALRVMPAYDADNDIGAVDRIRFAIINNRLGELRPTEIEQMDRWRKIDAWYRDRYYNHEGQKDKYGDQKVTYINSHRSLRAIVMAHYQMSYDTAERDIRNMKKFHAEVMDDQEYFRSVYIEDAERMALDACRCGKHLAGEKFLRLAADLRGLLNEKVEDFVYEKLEAVQFIIEYNPEAVNLRIVENKEELFEKWKAKRRSISDVMNTEAEDVDPE